MTVYVVNVPVDMLQIDDWVVYAENYRKVFGIISKVEECYTEHDDIFYRIRIVWLSKMHGVSIISTHFAGTLQYLGKPYG